MLGNICNNISMRYHLHPKAELHLGRNNAHNLSGAQQKQFSKSYQLKVTNGGSFLRSKKVSKQFSMVDFKRMRRQVNNSYYLSQKSQKENGYRKLQNQLNLNSGNNFKIVQKFPYLNNEIKQISILGDQQSKSTHDLMDDKFNRLLDFNLENQLQLSRQIESKFLIVEETCFQPDTIQEKFNIHQQLLEEENLYIREQLMIFTQEIQIIRQQNQQLFQENRKLREQLNQMSQLRQSLQNFIIDNQQRWFQLSACVEQSNLAIFKLRADNKQLQECLEIHQAQNKLLYQNLKRNQQAHGLEVERLTQQKQKQAKTMAQEIIEKYNQINQLNQSLTALNNKLKLIEEKSEFQDKLGQQIRYNKYNIIQQIQTQLNQEKGSKKLFLSMTEAEKLMNIIQQKQELQKRTIRALQCQLSNLQNVHQQQMLKMNQKIVKYQKYIDQLQLKNKEIKRFFQKNQLKDQINPQVQQKIAPKLCYLQQEQQLEDILQICLDQLEKYQTNNQLLQQQNLILRQSNQYEQLYNSLGRRNSIS